MQLHAVQRLQILLLHHAVAFRFETLRDANGAQRLPKHTRKDITNAAPDTAPFAHHGAKQIEEGETEEPREAK